MSKSVKRAQHFKPEASHAREGISVIFDIVGFSGFFNQPDVHSYIPKYLNHVIKCFEIMLFGGKTFWQKEKAFEMPPLTILPVHRKFLGDGALYIWAPRTSDHITESFIITLTNRLWNIQMQFSQVTDACVEFIPVAELPTGIRVGMARGTIYELSVENTTNREYIGVCINLASRLQKYCTGLNFIASARLNIPSSILEKHNYIKVVATKIKGFPKEVVIVDKSEYKQLNHEFLKDLFSPLQK